MSEVKVTIEWEGNTAGLHPDPRKVHIAGEADPNEIIGAIGEAMGMVSKPKEKIESKEDRVYRLLPITKRCVNLILPDGTRKPFASFREALDFIEAYSADERWED